MSKPPKSKKKKRAIMSDVDNKSAMIEEFVDLVREAAAEAADAPTSWVWEVRRHKDTIYRAVAIYTLYMHGVDPHKIASDLSYTRAYIRETINMVMAVLRDDENPEQQRLYQAALHKVTAAMNRISMGIRK